MLSRLFTGIRNSVNNPTITQRPSQRLSIEDSSEELVRATKPIHILSSTSIPAAFGLSLNEADDFIQKDLISNSWI